MSNVGPVELNFYWQFDGYIWSFFILFYCVIDARARSRKYSVLVILIMYTLLWQGQMEC